MTDEQIKLMDTYIHVLQETGKGIKALRRRVREDGNEGSALLIEMACAQLKDTINILYRSEGTPEMAFRSVRGKR